MAVRLKSRSLLLREARDARRQVALLRELLLEIYVSGSLIRFPEAEEIPSKEADRLYDTVLAAAEGRDFELLGLPFPRINF